MRRLIHRYGRFSWLLALAFWLGTPATTAAACCGPHGDPFATIDQATRAFADHPALDAHDPFGGHECRMDHLGLRTSPSRDVEPAATASPTATEREAPRPYTGGIAAPAAPVPTPPPTLATVRLLL